LKLKEDIHENSAVCALQKTEERGNSLGEAILIEEVGVNPLQRSKRGGQEGKGEFTMLTEGGGEGKKKRSQFSNPTMKLMTTLGIKETLLHYVVEENFFQFEGCSYLSVWKEGTEW